MSNTTKIFTKEFMLKLLDGSDAIISNKIVGHNSWSVSHRILFRHKDNVWEAHYSVGATEYQDESPWQYVNDIECILMKPVEKTVIVYEPA